jgi:hypothetical protein
MIAAVEKPLERMLLSNISWQTYENLLDEMGETHFRLTYDDGDLDIMTPSFGHEHAGTWIGRLIVYERHACKVPALCQPAASNEMRWEAVIEDISKSGVRLRLRRRFEPRSGLAVELPGKNGHETVHVKVMNVESDGNGSYVLGCHLSF